MSPRLVFGSAVCGLLSLVSAAFAADLATPLRWDVESSRPAAQRWDLRSPETVSFEPRFTSYNAPQDLSEATAVRMLYWTNSAAAAYAVTGSVVSATNGTVRIRWGAAQYPAAGTYLYMVQVLSASATTHRAWGTLGITAGVPGGTATNPATWSALDWAGVLQSNQGSAGFELLATNTGAAGQILTRDAGGRNYWSAAGSGSGDVTTEQLAAAIAAVSQAVVAASRDMTNVEAQVRAAADSALLASNQAAGIRLTILEGQTSAIAQAAAEVAFTNWRSTNTYVKAVPDLRAVLTAGENAIEKDLVVSGVYGDGFRVLGIDLAAQTFRGPGWHFELDQLGISNLVNYVRTNDTAYLYACTNITAAWDSPTGYVQRVDARTVAIHFPTNSGTGGGATNEPAFSAWLAAHVLDFAGVVLDWGTQTLVYGGETNLEWAAKTMRSSGVLSVHWGNRRLHNSGGTTSVDWQAAELYDLGTRTLNWEWGLLFPVGGPNDTNLNWTACYLASGNVRSLDWANRRLLPNGPGVWDLGGGTNVPWDGVTGRPVLGSIAASNALDYALAAHTHTGYVSTSGLPQNVTQSGGMATGGNYNAEGVITQLLFTAAPTGSAGGGGDVFVASNNVMTAAVPFILTTNRPVWWIGAGVTNTLTMTATNFTLSIGGTTYYLP